MNKMNKLTKKNICFFFSFLLLSYSLLVKLVLAFFAEVTYQ